MQTNLAVVEFKSKSAKPRCTKCVRGVDGKIATRCARHDRQYFANGVQAMTPVELNAFLTAARNAGLRTYAMILTLFLHGMRASELMRLKVSDVDFANGRIRITPLKRKDGRVFWEEFRSANGFDERAALMEYLKTRPDADPNEPLFLSRKSATRALPMNRSSFFALYQELAESIGLPVNLRHPHAARHSFGKNLYLKMTELSAIDLPKLTEALRHSNPQSVQVYVRPTSAETQKTVSNLLTQIL
jgi:integrase